MVRSIRPLFMGLISVLLAFDAPSLRAQDAPPADKTKEAEKPEDDAPSKAERARSYALPGEDPPAPFVPLHPRTVEDRKQVEAISTFAAARALEEHRRFIAAIERLEEALKLEPDSLSILRRLARLNLILGRTEKGMAYGKQVLTADPADSETLTRLVAHYLTGLRDATGAEALLKEVLANPKLGPDDSSRTLAEFELGKIYSTKLQQPEKAADAYAKVIAALDNKAANHLSPNVVRLILGGDEASSYQDFGLVFLLAKRYDLAVKAFERGLDYEPDDPQIPLLLAQTLLKMDKGEQALTMAEQFLKRQPQGIEGYEVIAKILTTLNREKEITPRLEQAAKIDSKNIALQYALADRYRETGEIEKAEAMYKQLLAAQPSSQGYAALAASLFKRKRGDELFKVILEAVGRPGGAEAMRDYIQGIGNDEKLANEVLDLGSKMAKNDLASLGRSGLPILTLIGQIAGKLDKVAAIYRLEVEKNPSPLAFKGYIELLLNAKKYGDAAGAIEELFNKFPAERNPRMVSQLGQSYRFSGQFDKAIAILREAIKLDPADIESRFELGIVLSQTGKIDESVKILREAADKSPEFAARIKSMIGGIFTTAGRNDEAIAIFKELLDRYPNDEDIFRTSHSQLSIIYVNMGDYTKGEAELELVLARNPDEAGVNNDLGYLYAEQGKNLEKAEAMIRKAVEQEPDNFAYLDSLGWVLFKRGKAKEAVDPLEKAIKAQIETNATDATVYEHLGDVYFQLHQTDKAKEAWKSAEKVAAKANPPDKRLPEIRKKLQSLEKLGAIPKPSTGDTP